MKLTRFYLFACAALLGTFHSSLASAQADPPSAPSAPGPAIDALVQALDTAKTLDDAKREQVARGVEREVQSPVEKERNVVLETSLEVLNAAGTPDANLAQSGPLVERYRQALLATSACKADCDSATNELKRSARELAFALEPQYIPKRDVYAVTLSASPIVRIQCNVSNDRGSDAVVFDPQDARGLTRHAVLPLSGLRATVTCTSDRLQETITEKETTATYFYILNSDDANKAATNTVLGCWRNSAEGARCPLKSSAKEQDEPALRVTIGEPLGVKESVDFLRTFTTISPQSTLRSLDPSTLALDLIDVLGTIALERANEGLKHYVRSYLLTQICENLTVKKIIDKLDGSPLYEPFKLLPPNEPILATTCSVLESIRIDELASAKDVLWKALMADASRLTFRSVLPSTALDPVSSSVFEAAHAVLARSLLGEQTGTERDVQAMLLSLERMRPDSSALKCGIVAGMAVLRLCLRDNTCSADELNQLIRQESADSSSPRRNDSLIRELTQKVVYEQGEYDDDAKVLAQALVDFSASATTPIGDGETEVKALKQALLQSLVNLREDDLKAELEKLTHAQIESGLKDSKANSKYKELVKVGTSRSDAFEVLKANLTPWSSACDLGAATAQWPALRPLLGKIGDVLQPPPGATVAATTANALEIVTDLALVFLDESFTTEIGNDVSKVTSTDWTVINGWQKKVNTTIYSRATVDALRLFIGVLRGEDPAPAVAELGKALSEAIKKHCEENGENGKCEVPVTSAQITRAFTVLTAVSSYAASYRAAGKDGEKDEAAREEERKKALESVIDAFTDRSHRAGEFVVSLGADVGFQFAHMVTPNDDKLPNGEGSDYVHNPFSMPMGLALQGLPNPQASGIGGHLMFTVIDPAQYATMNTWNSGAKFVRATPATAVRLGVRGGLLLGEPGFPISIVGHLSYSPALELWPEAEEGAQPVTPQSLSVWMYGLSAGIYVPFLDFN